MRTAIVHAKAGRPGLLDGGMVAGWGHAAALVGRWHQRQVARARLRDLDDRMLADVGLTREDALHEASKPFWQE